MAPPEAMQFGETLPRLLQALAFAYLTYMPVYLAKHNLSDGFCQLHLSLNSILPLAVLPPTPPSEAPLVALPLAVTMGWIRAPPSFCTTTETATDLANWSIGAGESLEPHHLEQRVDPSPTTEEGKVAYLLAPKEYTSPPLSLVDDIIGTTQGDTQQGLNITGAILHSVDKVFQPLEPDDIPKRQEPVSLKELDKGDSR